MVFARNSQFKVFFATTFRLRLRLHKVLKLLTDVRLHRPREESLGGWSVGELELERWRMGESWGRRQKQESGVALRSELCDLFVFVLKIMTV